MTLHFDEDRVHRVAASGVEVVGAKWSMLLMQST